MPEHLIRVTQTQLLADSSDIVLEAATPDEAAEIVLDAVAGDPDDETGTRSYGLPDGRKIEIDPEDAVIGGETYAEVIVAGQVVQTVGRTAMPIRRFLDLSTGHLQQADRLFLEFSANPGSLGGLAAMAGTYGWFVYAHDDRCCDGISDVLWTIFERARALGCEYVLFDADAPTLEGLPVFEENSDTGSHTLIAESDNGRQQEQNPAYSPNR